MKRPLPFVPLLLLAALLLFPASALAGAKQGLDIWWDRVLPALLPSFICVRLAEGMGLLHAAARRPKGQLIAIAGFSLLSGAPNGAKLLYAMARNGTLSQRESQRMLPLINNVSPVFLVSIIASDLLKNKVLFFPMALAFYGVILFFLTPHLLKKRTGFISCQMKKETFSKALSSAIENSMLDMLRIGGCILFPCTLLSVFHSLISNGAVYTTLAGLTEVSMGVSALAEAALPLRLKTSLMAGCAAFGGLSLALQTMCCYPDLDIFVYLIRKLLLGALIGAACYAVFPLFPTVSPVFASTQEMITRSLSLSSLLLSSVLSAAFTGMLSLMVSQRKNS